MSLKLGALTEPPSSKLNLPFASLDGSRPRASRVQRISRALCYLLALSAAATLSLFFPTSWSLLRAHNSRVSLQSASTDPASQWKDDIWPLRPQTPWDISTDFPYPRNLDYDVQEGTWLRLDVHPKSGDIVFDMTGDLYCLPASEVYNDGVTRARPVLLGVPYDSDPHFSPSGDRLVFRSDAELGVENIWIMEWNGCNEMDVRPVDINNGDLAQALSVQDHEDDMLAQGIKETLDRKHNRLLREGRHQVQRVTNETYRWVSDARFHPSGSKVVATKWYTSGRSLGAGEGWEYPAPSSSDLSSNNRKNIEAGSGARVLGRSLPLGWTVDKYGDQQIGPEQFIWSSKDTVIYSKNVRDDNAFTYSKDVHSGIYAIYQYNVSSGHTELLVSASPGGASRPELSRDGRTLAFVRRVRDKQALVLKDLKTGTINHVWHGLTYDLSTVSAPMGHIRRLRLPRLTMLLSFGRLGRFTVSPWLRRPRRENSFSYCSISHQIYGSHREETRKTRRSDVDVLGMETRDTQRVHAFKELRADGSGEKVVFQAAGVTYVQRRDRKNVLKVPTRHEDAPYYSPSFVHGADGLVLHARWSDTHFTTFEIADLDAVWLTKSATAIAVIAFVKSGGDLLTGDIVATAGAGLYIGELTLPSKGAGKSKNIRVHNLRFIPSDVNPSDRVNMRFLEGSAKLLIQQSDRAFVIDLRAGLDNTGKYTQNTIASGKMSSEIVISTHKDKGHVLAQDVAFVDFFHVYVVPGYEARDGQAVWSKPANATKGLVRLSLDGGHDITWSRDGKTLFWFLGSHLHSLEVSKIKHCWSTIKNDKRTFGISCVKNLLEIQEIDVRHTTDIFRLKQEAAAASNQHKPWLANNADTVVVFNATLLTMETGELEKDLIYNGVLVSRAGVIESAGALENFVVPPEATVINAHRGYVVPGFIDVHAHWSGFEDRYPAKSWEMETFLAYGVTTLHNPSADNVEGFDERSRIERGQLIGPRIFTVGDIIYGAGEPGIHQDIVDTQEAYSALVRIKAEGGSASISYKNYNLPSRASRQRLLLAARNLSMLCVPEGGMNLDWDLTYIIDGMTTVEHALPVPILYDDILTLFALSGTGSTPTHIVNYGGAWGEQLVWATEDIPNDPKLRRFTRHDILEELTESIARPPNSYALFNTSASVAKMVDMGLLAHIGAHGEPPLGLNYHAEMQFTHQGGLSNYEVIRAATSSGAKTLGMFNSLGSLSDGKLADFLIYPPHIDLLRDHISETRNLQYVARGGRIWQAETMEEVWPSKGRKQQLPPLNPE
ncbi:hypothetical protein BD779DRAFT_1669210 [Infundibulicybe gibba]|nr:hypothetical protein BD779DRAFT_1669210 [Infundibulicybe gibba]